MEYLVNVKFRFASQTNSIQITSVNLPTPDNIENIIFGGIREWFRKQGKEPPKFISYVECNYEFNKSWDNFSLISCTELIKKR